MCFANRSIIKNTDSDFKGCPTKCFCHLELSKQDIQKLFLFPTLIAAASQVLSHFNALNLRSVSALAPKAHPHRPNCTTSTLRITGNNSAFVQKTQGSFKARTVSTATSVLGEIAPWIFIKRPQHPAAQQLTSIWVTHDASMCVPVPIYMCVCVCVWEVAQEKTEQRGWWECPAAISRLMWVLSLYLSLSPQHGDEMEDAGDGRHRGGEGRQEVTCSYRQGGQFEHRRRRRRGVSGVNAFDSKGKEMCAAVAQISWNEQILNNNTHVLIKTTALSSVWICLTIKHAVFL